jgi:hypothetical protein
MLADELVPLDDELALGNLGETVHAESVWGRESLERDRH